MIDIFKFRMSGSQSQLINELLSSAKEKQMDYVELVFVGAKV